MRYAVGCALLVLVLVGCGAGKGKTVDEAVPAAPADSAVVTPDTSAYVQ